VSSVAHKLAAEELADKALARLSALRSHVAIQHLRGEIAPDADQRLWERVEKIVEVGFSISFQIPSLTSCSPFLDECLHLACAG
jgi:hypothetical protein